MKNNLIRLVNNTKVALIFYGFQKYMGLVRTFFVLGDSISKSLGPQNADNFRVKNIHQQIMELCV